MYTCKHAHPFIVVVTTSEQIVSGELYAAQDRTKWNQIFRRHRNPTFAESKIYDDAGDDDDDDVVGGHVVRRSSRSHKPQLSRALYVARLK